MDIMQIEGVRNRALTPLSPAQDHKWSPKARVLTDGTPVLLPSEINVSGDGDITVIVLDAAYANCAIHASGSGSVIVIGERCRLRRTTIAMAGNAIFSCGDRTSAEQISVIIGADTQITMGSDCMISAGVVIRSSDGHSIFDRQSRECINEPASVVIGDHVWLGNGARVNKGAQIGDGTVVGQSSIASGTLDAHCIYAGVPARLVRENISWSRTDSWDDIPEQFR